MTNIKVFTDFACPFCYIGFEIMNKLRKEDPSIVFEFMPLELNPEIPLEGSDLSNHVPQKQIEMGYRRIEKLAKEYDLIYNNKSRNFNTHRLLTAALYSEREDKFYEFSKEAFKAIFEYEKNVALPEVVNEIGLASGLNIVEMNNCIEKEAFAEEFLKAKELASVFEVKSIPTFIVNDKKKVAGLKKYDKFKKDLLGS